MHARNLFSMTLLSFSLTLAHAAWAHPEYRVTVMGPANSAATDINKAGVVVGNYAFSPTATHGFLNRGRGLVDLGALGGTSSTATAINDKGEVLGNWTNASGQRGFIYYAGKQRDIGILPGHYSIFTDINNRGYITVIDGQRSLLRAPNGKYTDIGSLPVDNPLTNAFALNNRNHITGQSGPLVFPDQPFRAIVWIKGVMRDLGDFGFDINSGLDINDRGQITGFASLPVGLHTRHAFLYSNGRLIDIDGRRDSDVDSSSGEGINNYGHVVGNSNHLSGFIYRGKRMQSLNALIDRRLGWDIYAPQAINDAGQIAATATRNGAQYAVRLDLIRPHLLAAPELEADDEALETTKPEAEAEAEAQADAAAQARELVRPVQQ